MIRSSIDLGTNTCLLLVGSRSQDLESDELKVLGDFAKVVRLGEGVDVQRKFQAVPMERTLACLKEYAAQVIRLGGKPSQTICVATSQARDASNSREFFEKIRAETGFVFRVISGQEEASLTFKGALLPGMDPSNYTVIDIGGGSTELIGGDAGSKVSFDIGSVRFTERYFKSQDGSGFEACQAAIDAALGTFRRGSKKGQLLAVAGTATTLAAWKVGRDVFDALEVEKVILTQSDLAAMVEKLRSYSMEQRRAIPCMEPMRADVILAGAMILWRALVLLGFKECRVSARGLRYGAILEEFPTE